MSDEQAVWFTLIPVAIVLLGFLLAWSNGNDPPH